ncbi:hypothetical protein CTAYLR_002164 [Chrysophaeum taylorii]|uniref:RING-type domain-containing protein n=1 Tax=Chrysophaeum taylorii TaxID=2483200 RepID=A0AAD7XU88_9STRA|nr:hypothetical protein CTAYLR_002164 [Chrysophaeum taylorii]
MEDDEKCVICGTDPSKFARNLGSRAVRLKTNAPRNEQCWHRFCTNCLDKSMMRQSQFKCPACGTLVRKATLDARRRDEIEVERDAAARRRVLAVYNTPRSAFASDREYNDFCESVEDAIFDLTQGGEAAKRVEAALKRYQIDNSADVARRASEKMEKERQAAARVRESKALAEAAAKRQRDEQRRLKLDKAQYEKHAMAYELGDRPDKPQEVVDPAVNLTPANLPLPTPLETVPDRPKLVKGQDLANRRLATAWSTKTYVARATLDLLATTFAAANLDADKHADKKRRLLAANAIPVYAPKVRVHLTTS